MVSVPEWISDAKLQKHGTFLYLMREYFVVLL